MSILSQRNVPEFVSCRRFLSLDRSYSRKFLSIGSLFLLSISALIIVVPGRSYVTVWLNDMMGLLDIANRFHLGKIPYRDFHFYYGPLVGLIPGIGLDIGLNAGSVFGFNAIVICAVLFLTAILSLPKRFSLLFSAPLLAYVWLLVVVPMGEGKGFKFISWGNFYNNDCWGALLLTLAFYVEPQDIRRLDKWTDAVSLSLLVLIQLYTKFTFGLVALSFVVANLFVSRYNRSVSILALLLTGATMATAELLYGFHAYYFADIEHFSQTVSHGVGPWGMVTLVVNNSFLIVSCFTSVFILRASGRHSAMDLLFPIAAVVAVGFLRTTVGVNREGALVALASIIVCMGELTRRNAISDRPMPIADEVGNARFLPVLCLALFIASISMEFADRAIALEDFGRKVLSSSNGPASGTPERLSGIIVPEDQDAALLAISKSRDPDTIEAIRRADGDRDLSSLAYMKLIGAGVDLLKTVNYEQHSVFAFDQVNPFLYALYMKPPANSYPLFWVGGPSHASRADKLPSAASLFCGADFVMVPRLPYNASQLSIMQRIYGRYLRNNYVLTRKSAYWELWMRRA